MQNSWLVYTMAWHFCVPELIGKVELSGRLGWAGQTQRIVWALVGDCIPLKVMLKCVVGQVKENNLVFFLVM